MRTRSWIFKLINSRFNKPFQTLDDLILMFLLISYLSLSLFYILLVIQFCIEREGSCPVLPDSQGRTWCSLPRQRSCGGLWGLWPELRLFRAWELYSGRRRVKPGSGDRNWVFRCFHHFSLLYFYSWTVHFQSLLCGGQDDVSVEDCSVDICLWDALILNIKESSDTSNNEGLKKQDGNHEPECSHV